MDSKKMDFVYIVREQTYGLYSSEVRVDHESIFTSKEKAEKYLHSLIDFETNQVSLQKYRIEMLAMPLDEEDPYDKIKQWIYDYNGKLLYCTEDNQQDPYQVAPKGIFQVGDIVYIKPDYYEFVSPSVQGDFGVVVTVPVNKDEWSAQGNNIDDWDNTYVVYFIHRDGIIDHWHLPEQVMEIPSEALPKELCFLNSLSKHFKGEIPLPDDFLYSVLYEIIYVENTKNLDLSDLDNPRIRSEVDC